MGTDIAFPLPGGRWPAGPDEGGYRWVHIPPAGGWGHPPLRRVTIDFVGAAVPSGPSITAAPPWSPSSVMACGHATFSPAGRRLWPFRRKRSNVDGVPLIRHGLRPCHLPPGEGIVRANLAFPLPGGGYIHSEIFKSDSTFRTEKCPVIPLPVPSYTVGYRGSRRIRRADAWRAKDVDWDGLCAGGWPWD